MSSLIFISGGSNEGDRIQLLLKAEKLMSESFESVVLRSSFYESKSWGYDGKDFLNIVWVYQTNYSPLISLRILQHIEQEMGRDKVDGEPYSDRKIDLDIIYYDKLIINFDGLIIPHPHMNKRRFVLEPLSEIAPDYIHPIINKTSNELLDSCIDDIEINKYDIV